MEHEDQPLEKWGAVPVEVLQDLVQDLRNPLVAAAGFLTLLERAEDGPAAKRYAASLRESIETLKEVVDRTRAAYCGTRTH
jgi:signal transduction histidine kinase